MKTETKSIDVNWNTKGERSADVIHILKVNEKSALERTGFIVKNWMIVGTKK